MGISLLAYRRWNFFRREKLKRDDFRPTPSDKKAAHQLLYSVDMSTFLQLDTQQFDPASAYTAAAAAAAAAGYNQRRTS